MKPFISVVIPSHNRKEELQRALQSLLSQSYPRELYEIIVVDDSIPPLTVPPEIRYIHLLPTSHSKARNKGISLAQGEIIAFTDDDCIPQQHWLENIAAHFTDDAIDGVEGKTTSDRMAVHFHATENTTGGNYPTCNIAFRKKTLQQTGGFDEQYGFFREDTDLAFSVLSQGGRIIFCEDVIVHHPPRKIPLYAPLRELNMIKSDIRLYKKYPDLYRKHIGFPGGGGVKIALLMWMLTLALFLIIPEGVIAFFPLILIILLKYATHLKRRIFSIQGYIGYIVFSWIRDLLYPFFYIRYFFF